LVSQYWSTELQFYKCDDQGVHQDVGHSKVIDSLLYFRVLTVGKLFTYMLLCRHLPSSI